MLALRVGIAAALTASAVIHVQLAPAYQQAAPGGIGQGTLFLIQAGATVLTAVFVLLKGSSASFAAAAIVGFSSLAAVILSRYVQVPPIGPLRQCMKRSGTQPRSSQLWPRPRRVHWR